MMDTNLIAAVVALFVIVGIFLICREIVCWYFKINQAVDLMDSVSRRLESIDRRLESIDRKNS